VHILWILGGAGGLSILIPPADPVAMGCQSGGDCCLTDFETEADLFQSAPYIPRQLRLFGIPL